MNLSEWFQSRLTNGKDDLIWALQQISTERHFSTPVAEGWSPAHHLVHILLYEQEIAYPSMTNWDANPISLGIPDEISILNNHSYLDSLIENFLITRDKQIALLDQFDEDAWQTTRPTLWGQKTLRWVVTKTVQHTFDHTNTLLGMALF